MRAAVVPAVVAPAAAVLVALAASGCESTQAVSARLEKQSKTTLLDQKGVTVAGASNPDVRVGEPVVLHDDNGTAVAVRVRARGSRTLRAVPLAVAAQDATGTQLAANDAPGLDPSLTSVPVLEPDAPVWWVNDQLQAPRAPRRATVKAGDAKPLPGAVPELVLRDGGLERDEVSGASAVGSVTNRSDIEQRDLVVYAVARRGGEVVAAGRGQIPRLKPGRTVAYQVFFIGDPTGAELALAVPPTVLK